MIDRNIKNSMITRTINSVSVSPSEKLPFITVERKNFIESKNVGETNIIKIEITMQAKPQSISINAVKYFEFNSSFFVTGRVWVRYDSSL